MLHFSSGPRRFVLAWAPSSASTSARGKLTARLVLHHTRFRVAVSERWLFRLTAFRLSSTRSLLRRLLTRSLFLRRTALSRSFRGAFLLVSTGGFATSFARRLFFNDFRCPCFFLVVADALETAAVQCVRLNVVDETRNMRLARTASLADRFAFSIVIGDAFERRAAPPC